MTYENISGSLLDEIQHSYTCSPLNIILQTMETSLQVPQGTFDLTRLPKRRNELLRAWDAADEYLLNYLAGEVSLTPELRILILNDSFGALAVALHEYLPSAVSDSWLSQQSTLENMMANDLSIDDIRLYGSLVMPQDSFDLVLI